MYLPIISIKFAIIYLPLSLGKRKIRRYNRNAAYEQELHREANRRAAVRAKREASSRARERLQQQQRRLLTEDDDDEDDEDDEEEEEEEEANDDEEEEHEEGEETEEDDSKEAAALRRVGEEEQHGPGAETVTCSGRGGGGGAHTVRKSIHQATATTTTASRAGKGGNKDNQPQQPPAGKGSTTFSHVTTPAGQKTAGVAVSQNVAGPSTSHKEDYESDVEDVPDDLAEEMVASSGDTGRSRKKMGGASIAGAGSRSSGAKAASRSKHREVTAAAHESEHEDVEEVRELVICSVYRNVYKSTNIATRIRQSRPPELVLPTVYSVSLRQRGGGGGGIRIPSNCDFNNTGR